jgi:hypothetical protein
MLCLEFLLSGQHESLIDPAVATLKNSSHRRRLGFAYEFIRRAYREHELPLLLGPRASSPEAKRGGALRREYSNADILMMRSAKSWQGGRAPYRSELHGIDESHSETSV